MSTVRAASGGLGFCARAGLNWRIPLARRPGASPQTTRVLERPATHATPRTARARFWCQLTRSRLRPGSRHPASVSSLRLGTHPHSSSNSPSWLWEASTTFTTAVEPATPYLFLQARTPRTLIPPHFRRTLPNSILAVPSARAPPATFPPAGAGAGDATRSAHLAHSPHVSMPTTNRARVTTNAQ